MNKELEKIRKELDAVLHGMEEHDTTTDAYVSEAIRLLVTGFKVLSRAIDVCADHEDRLNDIDKSIDKLIRRTILRGEGKKK